MRLPFCSLIIFCGLCVPLFAEKAEVARLAQQLQDDDPAKSADAAEALGKLGPAAIPALPQLIKALEDERATPRMVEHYIPGLNRYPLSVSQIAEAAIVEIGEPSVPFLVQELKRKRKPTREQVIFLLRSIGKPAKAALPELVAIVESRTRDELRVTAAYTYHTIADNNPLVLDQMIHWVNDSHMEIRYLALARIGTYGTGGAAAVPAITKRLSDKANVRQMISDHFGYETPLRQFACQALGEIGAPSRDAVPQLHEMMRHDPEPVVRVAAALAASRIDPSLEEGVQVLIEELQRSRDAISAIDQAAAALGELGPRAERAWDLLVEMSKEKDWERSRWTALRALQEIDGPRSLKLLMGALENDPEILVRKVAAECLGELGAKAAPSVPALIHTLDLSSEELFSDSLRAAAAKSLGQIGPLARDALPSLEKLRDSEGSDGEKEAAAEAIRAITTASFMDNP